MSNENMTMDEVWEARRQGKTLVYNPKNNRYSLYIWPEDREKNLGGKNKYMRKNESE